MHALLTKYYFFKSCENAIKLYINGSCTRIATEFSYPLKKKVWKKYLFYDKVLFSGTVYVLWILIISSQEFKGFVGCSNKGEDCNS